MGLAIRILRWWWIPCLGSLVLAFVLPAFVGSRAHLPINRAFSQISTLETALEAYREKYGEYPGPDEGLEGLKRAGLVRLPRDPWGSRYVYWYLASMPRPMIYSPGVNGFDEAGGGDDVTTPEKSYCCVTYRVDCPLTLSDVGLIAGPLLFIVSLLAGITHGLIRSSCWPSRSPRERGS